MSKLDETTLLAYVDGTLDAAQAHEVETALASDAAAREMLEQMRAMPGSLREAFDSTLARPLSPKYAELILSRRLERAPKMQLRYPHAVIAALVLFVVGVGVGLFASDWRYSKSSMIEESWVSAVVDYQVLYGRETLNRPDASTRETSQTERRLTQQLGHSVVVPDLRKFGLAFKRGQLLDFQGVPVIQLAYLPAMGKPVAYCISRERGPDIPPVLGHDKGLTYLHWREAGYGHILVGAASNADLQRMVDVIRATASPAT